MWRNCQSGGCSISQYEHISAIFYCIALIFCMHQYFLKMRIPYFISFVAKMCVKFSNIPVNKFVCRRQFAGSDKNDGK